MPGGDCVCCQTGAPDHVRAPRPAQAGVFQEAMGSAKALLPEHHAGGHLPWVTQLRLGLHGLRAELAILAGRTPKME